VDLLPSSGEATQRARHVPVARYERRAADGARVITAAVTQRGVVERVEPVGLARQRFEGYVDEHRGACRVCRIGLGDAVLAVFVRVYLPVGQSFPVDELHLLVGGPGLAFGERLAVADDEL
jgi:hypothetical protein